MRVVTTDEMREIERRAEAEHGLTSPLLMEQAGRSCATLLRDVLAARGTDIAGRTVLVLVGPGNNGGDGRVMGRYLAEAGARVILYDWRERRLEVGERHIPIADDLAALEAVVAVADVVADALLGTGHSRPLDPTMRRALALVRDERMRRPSLVVLGVDLPSGLNADTGAVDPGTIPCDLTVTLAFPKVGLLLFPGAGYVGELRIGGIGLPTTMSIPPGLDLLDAALVRPALPPRPPESNKGTYGKVLVVAGSSLYIGAAYLATAAAGRVGAGLITLATTAERAPIYATRLAEATYKLLPPDDAGTEARVRAVLDASRSYTALVVGPGLGQSDEARAVLTGLFDGLRALPESDRPRLLVDADGLNTLASLDRWWERLPARTVLTPHPGEMARLREGEKVSGGGPDRLTVAAECARQWGHVVVLKGAATVVAHPDGRTRIAWPPNAALATGGTGDVLSGTIGGLLAQGMDSFDAASAGVVVHALAGQRVAARTGDAGLLAGDLLTELPVALKEARGG